MKQQINEIKRMQQLAGILKENQYNEKSNNINIPIVTYTVIYNGQTFYYREHLDGKAGLYDIEVLDSNNIKLDEESDLFNEIMDYIEGTFIDLYRNAN